MLKMLVNIDESKKKICIIFYSVFTVLQGHNSPLSVIYPTVVFLMNHLLEPFINLHFLYSFLV